MKRSHRLLREAHARRQDRFTAAGADGYDFLACTEAMEGVVCSLVRDGLLAAEVAHPAIEATLGDAVRRLEPLMGAEGLSGEVARGMAGVAFAGWPRADGRVVVGDRDRRTALACAAVGRAAVMERVLRAAGEVLRRAALRDHRAEPAWPEGYLERRAREAAEALQAARGAASGLGGPLGEYVEARGAQRAPLALREGEGVTDE